MFKKIYSILSIALMFAVMISKAQTPLQINGLDCNGINHDMYSELDAGKAVVVFFFMDNCSSCPPVAQKVQTMVNNVLATYPNMVTGYAMPYNNSTTCTATANWVANNSLSFYSPYDSGAVQVANYGGFGMPTVVLLGGKAPNQRVLFSTLSFANGDTTIMRDSIINLFAPTGINTVANLINAASIYPNPANDNATISVELKEQSNMAIDVLDITGKVIATICNEKNNIGTITKQLNTASFSNGIYSVRINVNGNIVNKKLHVCH